MSVIVAIFFSLILVFCSCPSVGWYDSGELSTAGFQLGIPHPTGFPIYMILMKLFQIVPVGNIAFRANLLSCFLGALSFLIICLLIEALKKEKNAEPSQLFSGFTLAGIILFSSGIFTLHTLNTELYCLTTFISLLILSSSLIYEKKLTEKTANLIILSTAMFLSMPISIHISVLFNTAIASLFLTTLLPFSFKRKLLLIIPVAIILATPVLYLYIRSIENPQIDWGNPETLRSLLEHITGKRIRTAYQSSILNIHTAGIFTLQYFKLIGDNIRFEYLAIAIVGAVTIISNYPLVALCFSSSIILELIYSVMINPMGIRDEQVGLTTIFIISFMAGVGIITLINFIMSLIRRKSNTANLLRLTGYLTGIALLLYQTLFINSFRRKLPLTNYIPTSMVYNSIKHLHPFTTVFCQSDNFCGISLYLQKVEGVRNDLFIVPRQHIWDNSIFRWLANKQFAILIQEIKTETSYYGKLKKAVNTSTKLFATAWEYGDGTDERIIFDNYEQLTAFDNSKFPIFTITSLALKLAKRQEADLKTSIFSNFNRLLLLSGTKETLLRSLYRHTAREIAHQLTTAGNFLFRKRMFALSRQCYISAISVYKDYPPALINLAVLKAMALKYEDAIETTLRALHREPSRRTGYLNLGIFYREIRQYDKAKKMLEVASRLNPHWERPYEECGILFLKTGDNERAKQCFREALKRNPASLLAREGLKKTD